MRDNTFRAKVKYPKSSTAFIGCDKNEGEWAVGDLHVRAAIPHIHNLWKRYPIDKDTVGQFIGLYDSQDRPIFKGDIIQSAIEGYNSKHEVIYVKEEAAFLLHPNLKTFRKYKEAERSANIFGSLSSLRYLRIKK